MTWHWQKFINEARTDGLQLEHWSKYFKDSAGNMKPEYEGPYRWAKLNMKVSTTDSEVVFTPIIAPVQLPRYTLSLVDAGFGIVCMLVMTICHLMHARYGAF